MIRYAEVIGDPISHSKSPLIHGFWIKACELEADYLATHVPIADVGEYLKLRAAEPEWVGCNVTMPLKEAVVPFLAELDPVAQHLGAVNTIVRGPDGTLRGYNTDVMGVFEPLRQAEKPGFPTYVQVIGSGGAAKAAVIGSIAAGYGDFDIFNRTPEKADPVAKLSGSPFGTAHALDKLGPMQHRDDEHDGQKYSHILINATSMGMNGNNPVPVDLSAYYPDTIVFDMVYAPLETPLLAQARANGLRTIDGLDMLVGQAAAAFDLFFGVRPPRDRDAELRGLLEAASR